METEKFVEDCRTTLGENLVSIVEYGKIETLYLVVVTTLGFDELKEVASLTKKWAKKLSNQPLFLTKEELTDGLDVFPLEFLNIQLNHRMLYGDDFLTELKFNKDHVRRELEFEFRSKLINLRQGYLEVSGSAKDLKKLVGKAIPTLMPILNGLLYVRDVEIALTVDEILSSADDNYEASFEILNKIKDKDVDKLSIEFLEDYIKQLIILLSELAEELDEMRFTEV